MYAVLCYRFNVVSLQLYSNGLSEIMLGKAIRELKLPREELVIMTKVSIASRFNN